ncbi:MAG: CAP domain-containing protein [bacterium]
MGYSDPAGRVVERWLNSPGHKKNIEGNYNLTGIGVVQANNLTYYFTQIFVLSR